MRAALCGPPDYADWMAWSWGVGWRGWDRVGEVARIIRVRDRCFSPIRRGDDHGKCTEEGPGDWAAGAVRGGLRWGAGCVLVFALVSGQLAVCDGSPEPLAGRAMADAC